MPEGQFSGKRDAYIYVSDDNNTYLLQMDVTLAEIDGTDLTIATVANATGSLNKPTRFTPRGVHWQATAAPIGARKFLVCGSSNADLYVSTTSTVVIIDGVAGVTTGRRGETFSYLRLADAPAP